MAGLLAAQRSLASPEAPSAERRVAGVAAGALDLRWLALTLFWPLVDLGSPEAPLAAALAMAAGYGLAGAAAALPLARLSDARGRRPVLGAATGLLLGGAALLLAPGTALPALGRLLMGAGAGAGPAVAWLADAVAVDRRPRAQALLALSASLAPPVGILLGAAMGMGPRWAAPVLVAACAAVAFGALARTPEVPPLCAGAALRADSLFALREALRTPALAGPLAATACGYGALALASGLVPAALAAQPGARTAAALALGAAGAAAALAAASGLSNRGQAPLALALGAAAAGFAGALLAAAAVGGGAPQVLPALPLLAGGAAAAAAAGMALLLERSPEMWRGTLIAAHQAACLLGAGAGGALGVVASRAAGLGMALVPLAGLVLCAAASALLPRAGSPPSRRS